MKLCESEIVSRVSLFFDFSRICLTFLRKLLLSYGFEAVCVFRVPVIW